jgi:hypothetical protein
MSLEVLVKSLRPRRLHGSAQPSARLFGLTRYFSPVARFV